LEEFGLCCGNRILYLQPADEHPNLARGAQFRGANCGCNFFVAQMI
jgi:hypothetical protein